MSNNEQILSKKRDGSVEVLNHTISKEHFSWLVKIIAKQGQVRDEIKHETNRVMLMTSIKLFERVGSIVYELKSECSKRLTELTLTAETNANALIEDMIKLENAAWKGKKDE